MGSIRAFRPAKFDGVLQAFGAPKATLVLVFAIMAVVL